MTVAPDRLERSVVGFMRYFLAPISPILQRTVYRGRLFPESEMMVMMALSVAGPQSPTQISRGLGMQKGSLTSALRRLEGAGFIARRDNPGDDRSYIAEMTKDGVVLSCIWRASGNRGFARCSPPCLPRISAPLPMVSTGSAPI